MSAPTVPEKPPQSYGQMDWRQELEQGLSSQATSSSSNVPAQNAQTVETRPEHQPSVDSSASVYSHPSMSTASTARGLSHQDSLAHGSLRSQHQNPYYYPDSRAAPPAAYPTQQPSSHDYSSQQATRPQQSPDPPPDFRAHPTSSGPSYQQHPTSGNPPSRKLTSSRSLDTHGPPVNQHVKASATPSAAQDTYPAPRTTPEGIHDMGRIDQLLNCRKFYAEGYVMKRVARGPDGRMLPPTDATAIWDRWYCQLAGSELSMWNVRDMEDAAARGTTVPPQYLRIADSHVVPIPSRSPDLRGVPPQFAYGFSLNNAAFNQILFAVEDEDKLRKWVNMLRLAEWEYARLQSIFTGTLLGLRQMETATSPLTDGRLEGQLEVRIPGEKYWRKLWVTLTVPGKAGSLKSRRRSSIFSLNFTKENSSKESTDEFASVSLYANPKSKRPFLQIKDVWYCAAVYPEHQKLIWRTSIFRLEGTCIWDQSAEMPKGIHGPAINVENNMMLGRACGRGADQQSILLMPEESGSAANPSAAQISMLKMITGVCDVFKLYGRGGNHPPSFSFDPRDPDSPYFAYPIGQHRDRLFIDTPLCSNLNIMESQPHNIKNTFLSMLRQRMQQSIQQPRMHSPPSILMPSSQRVSPPQSSAERVSPANQRPSAPLPQTINSNVASGGTAPLRVSSDLPNNNQQQARDDPGKHGQIPSAQQVPADSSALQNLSHLPQNLVNDGSYQDSSKPPVASSNPEILSPSPQRPVQFTTTGSVSESSVSSANAKDVSSTQPQSNSATADIVGEARPALTHSNNSHDVESRKSVTEPMDTTPKAEATEWKSRHTTESAPSIAASADSTNDQSQKLSINKRTSVGAEHENDTQKLSAQSNKEGKSDENADLWAALSYIDNSTAPRSPTVPVHNVPKVPKKPSPQPPRPISAATNDTSSTRPTSIENGLKESSNQKISVEPHLANTTIPGSPDEYNSPTNTSENQPEAASKPKLPGSFVSSANPNSTSVHDSTTNSKAQGTAFGASNKRVDREKASVSNTAPSRHKPGRGERANDKKQHAKSKLNQFNSSDEDEDDEESEKSSGTSSNGDTPTTFAKGNNSIEGSTSQGMTRQPSIAHGPRPLPESFPNNSGRRSLPVPPNETRRSVSNNEIIQSSANNTNVTEQKNVLATSLGAAVGSDVEKRQSQMLGDNFNQPPQQQARRSWDPRASFFGYSSPKMHPQQSQQSSQYQVAPETVRAEDLQGKHRVAPRSETFVNLNEPSNPQYGQQQRSQQFDMNGVPVNQGFMPHGLLTQHDRVLHEKSAKGMEASSRETGAPLLDVPRKPPPPQTGLVGAIASMERDKRERGGLAGQLADKQREVYGEYGVPDNQPMPYGHMNYGSGPMNPYAMPMNPMQMQAQMQAMYAAQAAYFAAMQNQQQVAMSQSPGSPPPDNSRHGHTEADKGQNEDAMADSPMGMAQYGMGMGMPQMGMSQMGMPQMGMPQVSMPQMGMGFGGMYGGYPVPGYMPPEMSGSTSMMGSMPMTAPSMMDTSNFGNQMKGADNPSPRPTSQSVDQQHFRRPSKENKRRGES